MRIVAIVSLAAALAACRTAAPGSSDTVKVTRNVADVEHCKPVGAVQTIAPYALPGDDIKQIRSRTVAVGADTVLLNASRSASTKGVAYRCRST
jgi:collagenase-like PrtC family protease